MGNATLGLRYEAGDHPLHGYSDASWDEDKSVSGWACMWQNAVLSWGSNKQHAVSLSSCEAELYALSEAAKDMVFLRKFVSSLDANATDGPTLLRTDNKAARDLSYNPEHHHKTKHISRRHFFVRDMVENFELQVPLVGTADNIADFFTKCLGSSDFFRFRDIIMNVPRE